MAIEKKFIREQVNRLLIGEYLQKETDRAGFGGLEIQRTPMGTRVSIVAERPGMIIGRKGSTINALTNDIATKFNAENPQIEVVEAGRDANINAHIMARKVAEALERGWHFRRAGHSTVQRIMESGAKGCIVILQGKLTGQRHRTEKFIAGHIKYCGETALETMMVGYAQCKKKLGTIGCTVKIMYPDAKLPDEITVFEPGQKAMMREAQRRPEGVAAAGAPAAPAVPQSPAETQPAAGSVAAKPAGERAELPSERHKRLEAEKKAKRKSKPRKEEAAAPATAEAEEAKPASEATGSPKKREKKRPAAEATDTADAGMPASEDKGAPKDAPVGESDTPAEEKRDGSTSGEGES